MVNRSTARERPDHHEDDDAGEEDFTEDEDNTNEVLRRTVTATRPFYRPHRGTLSY